MPRLNNIAVQGRRGLTYLDDPGNHPATTAAESVRGSAAPRFEVRAERGGTNRHEAQAGKVCSHARRGREEVGNISVLRTGNFATLRGSVENPAAGGANSTVCRDATVLLANT